VADLKRLIESDPEHARNYLRDGKRSLMEVALGAKRDDDIELLLQEGWNADVMRQGEAIPQGWTPLTAAAFSGDEKLVAMLLQYGADPELCDSSGHSALQIATERGHDNVVAILKRAIHRRMHPGDTNPPLPSSRP